MSKLLDVANFAVQQAPASTKFVTNKMCPFGKLAFYKKVRRCLAVVVLLLFVHCSCFLVVRLIYEMGTNYFCFVE